MDNFEIAGQLTLLSKLMEIHGENSFKARSYSSAAFAIEKLPQPLPEMPPAQIFRIKGIGESVGKKVIELIETGELDLVGGYISRTPQGVLEMMNIKGLGPKKINTIWKEMNIETIDDLEAACMEGKIAVKKGFGDKTQEKILESIRFRKSNAGWFLYAQVESFAQAFSQKLRDRFPGELMEITGAFRRQLEVMELLEWVTTIPVNSLKEYLERESVELVSENKKEIVFSADGTIHFKFHLCDRKEFWHMLFITSCSSEFLDEWKSMAGNDGSQIFSGEEEIFERAGLPFIPVFMRERDMIARSGKIPFSGIIQPHDIRGLIHAHSNWSDGSQEIEEMAVNLTALGFEYLVISDHSKSAFYANGLTEQRIREQHRYIDELNDRLAPFRIFKSIECDILNDGSLDYDDETLSLFDLVIASVHSNQNMDQEKAMKRLLRAIEHPATTILGHMTGRLLLRRNGYPVDHEAIIEACARNGVVIEVNANPNRLDMDWRWISRALDKNVMLSINPDAHTSEEFRNTRYGVLVAQKGGLTADRNLSSFTLKDFEKFLSDRKKVHGRS